MQKQIKENKNQAFTPSKLFIYYNEREIEGTVNIDCGAQLRDGIKSVNAQGVCKETLYPYIIEKFKESDFEDLAYAEPFYLKDFLIKSF